MLLWCLLTLFKVILGRSCSIILISKGYLWMLVLSSRGVQNLSVESTLYRYGWILYLVTSRPPAELGVDSSRLEPLKSVSIGATAIFSKHNFNWFYAESNWKYKKYLRSIPYLGSCERILHGWWILLYKLRLIVDIIYIIYIHFII